MPRSPSSVTAPAIGSPEPATSLEPPEPRARGREALAHVASALGTIAALVGAAVVLWAVLAPLVGLSLVVFATGSMSPTIPQGALALVQRVDADELEVGRVTMLQRPGEQPISHRILSIVTDPRDPDVRIVTMQGDDNPVPDAEPYRVASGGVVLASISGGMPVLALIRSPVVMGLLTIIAAGLVLRAFWPASPGSPGSPGSTAPTASTAGTEQE